MTEFERIKAMDAVALAIYIKDLQLQAIKDYRNGFFPNGIFDNLAMLNGDAKQK